MNPTIDLPQRQQRVVNDGLENQRLGIVRIRNVIERAPDQSITLIQRREQFWLERAYLSRLLGDDRSFPGGNRQSVVHQQSPFVAIRSHHSGLACDPIQSVSYK